MILNLNRTQTNNFKKTAVILFVVAAVWFILDRVTKIYFDSGQFALGQNISDSILGIFHLTLVHNTGAAFGIFGNSTIVLGIISVIVSIFLLALPFALMNYKGKNNFSYKPTFIQLFAIGIVVSGGIGNAIDRFVTGYVVDFICFDFIDFPVFNIADIGVTCGVVILVTLMMYYSFSKTK